MGKNQIRANAEEIITTAFSCRVNQSEFKVEKSIELKVSEY